MAQATRNTPTLEVPSSSPNSPPSPKLLRPKLGVTGATSRTATSQRLPPPTLFQGPPSKNASHISLALPSETHKKDGAASDTDRPDARSLPRPSKVPPATSFSTTGPALRPPPTQADDFRAESLWAEMQKTLADVELSAMNPSHVFGAGHAKALEDLRTAQLGLAQAWAKSAADEVQGQGGGGVSDDDGEDEVVGAMGTKALPGKGDVPGKDAGKGVGGSSFANNKNLEEETERDIRLARKRREANDRYFSQVNKGVLDVVGMLDEVASAMRRVEKESRDIWESSGDDEGLSGEDVSETGDSALVDSPDSPMDRKR